MLHLVDLSVFIQKDFFCLEFELPRVQPCWFTLYQGRAEKSCLVMYLILLPHMPAFFYGSNTDYWAKDGDNHGCILVTLSVIFLITNLMRNPMKNCYICLFLTLFLSVGSLVILWFCSVLKCLASLLWSKTESRLHTQFVIWLVSIASAILLLAFDDVCFLFHINW